MGRAGGFANSAFRARVAESRKAGSPAGKSRKSAPGFLKKASQRSATATATRLAASAYVGVTIAGIGAAARAPVLGAVAGGFAAGAVWKGTAPSSQKRATARPKNPAGRKVRK